MRGMGRRPPRALLTGGVGRQARARAGPGATGRGCAPQGSRKLSGYPSQLWLSYSAETVFVRGIWKESAERYPVYAEHAQHALLKDSLCRPRESERGTGAPPPAPRALASFVHLPPRCNCQAEPDSAGETLLGCLSQSKLEPASGCPAPFPRFSP